MKGFFHVFPSAAIFISALITAVMPARAGDWNPVNPSNSPAHLFGHSMVSLADGSIITFGGENAGGELFNDLFVFKDNNWNPVSADNPPTARYGHMMVTLPDGEVVLFGGENAEGDMLDDLFVFKNANWNPLSAPGVLPPPRKDHSGVWVPAGAGSFVTFGGVGTDGLDRRDVWLNGIDLYGEVPPWYQRGDCPISTRGAAAVAEDWGAYLLGYDDNTYYYDVGNAKWHTLAQSPPYPSGRRYAAVAYHDGKAYLCGGQDVDTDTVLDETWEFDVASRAWSRLSDMPEGLTRAGAAWYSYTGAPGSRRATQGRVILFGGQRSDWSVSSQTYEFWPEGAPPAGASPWNQDYNGDGTSDIAVFREGSGLWAIRGISRMYFGGTDDEPVPGDYDADGTTDVGIFRAASGLWAIRGVTRTYFGGSADTPVPLWLNPSSATVVGIFRPTTGLWAVKGVTRAYFGGSGDEPVPGDYDGDSTEDLGIFRNTSGLWAIRGVTRAYFGGSADSPVPGEYSGDGTWEPGIFRPSSGLWAIRGVTRSYFGAVTDWESPADYDGDGTDDIGIFRDSSGLWAVRSITRCYFGTSGDIPVAR